MNRFAIEEDDQFEIHVKEYTRFKRIFYCKERIWGKDNILTYMHHAAEEVMRKAQQGLGYYRLEIKNI